MTGPVDQLTEEDHKTAKAFNKLFLRVHPLTWMSTTWRGISVAKPPTDMWVYQEIITRNRPDMIIETGTYAGGSACFFADVANLEGPCKVVTVDVSPLGWAQRKDHPNIEFLIGSSLDPEVANKICERAKQHKRVMVVLDSLHDEEHVLSEMELYGPLVSPGQYLVIEDTVTMGEPRRAIERYLDSHPGSFERDPECDRLMLSFCTEGWLRKVSQ